MNEIRNIRKLITEEISRCTHLKHGTIDVGGTKCSVEIADDDFSRNMGLMFRESLPDNHGMLFIFPEVATRGFWMRNTIIPLSIAFIDENGYITNIEDMHPHDLQSSYSSRPARCALEMNRGWFRKNGIGKGSKIIF